MFKKLTAIIVLIITILSLALPSMKAISASTNLITNPSVETGTTKPTNWVHGKWGTNTATFSYKTTEGHSGSRSNFLQMTKRTSGDAKWYFTHTAVKPNQLYTYSEWYKSNVATEIDVELASTTGKFTYLSLVLPAASPSTWQQSISTFTTPTDVKTLSVFHVLDRVGTLQTDDFSLTAGTEAPAPPVVVPPTPTPTAPNVSFSAPVANSTINGITTIQATATDAVGVAGVQFKVDSANIGSEDTTSPYSVALNTTTLANGTHNISATARNTSSLTTSASVSVNVQNAVINPPVPVPTPIPGNLIANPSFETAVSNTPQGWSSSAWGTNSTAFTYLNTGRTGSRSVKAEVKTYSNGAANWFYNGVNVTAGKTYKYENWYQSNVDNELDAEVVMANGTTQYFYLGNVFASATWAKSSTVFSVPSGAKTLAIYPILTKKGYVISDDYLLSEYTPAQFSRGLISLNFDDGWRSIYTNGLPLLKSYGMPSTQYLNSTPIMDGYPDYMTYQNVKDFVAQGSEVAWHTRSHADLTTLTAANLTTELSIPGAFLTNIDQPASAFMNFASPYGAYNKSSVTEISKLYRSHRSVEEGYNSKDNFNIYDIKVQNILNTTTPAEVQGWVTKALADKIWLVLVYHEVSATASDPSYAVTPANLNQELNIIKQSGITVKTVNQALDEITAQL